MKIIEKIEIKDGIEIYARCECGKMLKFSNYDNLCFCASCNRDNEELVQRAYGEYLKILKRETPAPEIIITGEIGLLLEIILVLNIGNN